MAVREMDKRLKELKVQGKHLYSISKLNTIHQCKYQAYLNYILHEKQKDNIWACAGSIIHDRLEGCLKGINTPQDIKSAIDDELENFQMLDIDFPLDKNGNPTIRNNWVANMTKFAEMFKPWVGNFETEQLVILPINDNAVMQGYVDVISHNDDGTVDVIDWKTSSQFTGDHLIEAGRQLAFYTMALEAEGLTVRSAKWVMLKYYEATYKLKNGKFKTKVGEWRNLVSDLSGIIEKYLLELGIDEISADVMLTEAKKTNTIPKELSQLITVSPYIREYELTDDVKAETMQYIKDTIAEYEGIEEWKPCNCKNNSYFCANLCGYGGKSGKCKHWIDYCETFEKKSDDEEDLF